MRRRRIGGGRAVIARRREDDTRFSRTGAQMAGATLSHVQEQLRVFRANLEEFARKYKDDIRKDPVFRREFQVMCAKIGVDPLASSKGFWAELLGVGAFYTELGVQIIDACVSTRAVNGGLIAVPALIQHVKRMRGSNALSISADDIERAVKQLRVLGSGFKVVEAGARKMVVSVPVELNRDHALLLFAAQQSGGYVTVESMCGGDHQWDRERVMRALQLMLKQGMCWEDRPSRVVAGAGSKDGSSGVRYWFASVWRAANEAK